MRRFWVYLIFGLIWGLPGCKEPDPSVTPLPREPTVETRSVLNLRANQLTLLELSNGRLFYHQPDADPDLGLQILEPNGQSRTTDLTPQRVADLLKLPTSKPVLRSILALPDGRLLAYFNGTERTQSLCSLVLYDPMNQDLQLLAGAETLAGISEMGLLLDLADAQLVRFGSTVWLCLIHSDRSVFLQFDARKLVSGTVRLAKAFQDLKLDDTPFRLKPGDQLSGQSDETVWLFRPSTSELWQIHQDGKLVPVTGVEHRGTLTVYPLSPGRIPAWRGVQRVWFIASIPRTADLTIRPILDDDITRYPILIYESEKESLRIERDDWIVRQGFPVYAIRVTRWVVDPTSGDILAYDGMSGEVFRLTPPFR